MIPAYALDATSRMMGYAMGGSSEKLPRAGEATLHPGRLSSVYCFHPLEGWLSLSRVWLPTILEIQTTPMDLREVQATNQSFSRHTLPGYEAPINVVVSNDLVVCWPQKWGKRAFTHAKLWDRQLSNLVEAAGEITLLHRIADASRIE